MSSYTDLKPPLVAHFVWHPNDHDRVYPLIEKFRKYLTRDIKKPFSRELNIPTFLYMSSDIRGVPSSIPGGSGLHNVVFLFVSHNMVSQDKKWKSYIDSIHKSVLLVLHKSLMNLGLLQLDKLMVLIESLLQSL